MNHEELLAYLTKILVKMAEQEGVVEDIDAVSNFVREFYAELVINNNYNKVMWIRHLRETVKIREVRVDLPKGIGAALSAALSHYGTPILEGAMNNYILIGRRSTGLKEAKDFTEFMAACVRQIPHQS